MVSVSCAHLVAGEDYSDLEMSFVEATGMTILVDFSNVTKAHLTATPDQIKMSSAGELQPALERSQCCRGGSQGPVGGS